MYHEFPLIFQQVNHFTVSHPGVSASHRRETETTSLNGKRGERRKLVGHGTRTQSHFHKFPQVSRQLVPSNSPRTSALRSFHPLSILSAFSAGRVPLLFPFLAFPIAGNFAAGTARTFQRNPRRNSPRISLRRRSWKLRGDQEGVSDLREQPDKSTVSSARHFSSLWPGFVRINYRKDARTQERTIRRQRGEFLGVVREKPDRSEDSVTNDASIEVILKS